MTDRKPPPAVPGIPGARLPPPTHARRGAETQTGMSAPPAVGSAPAPAREPPKSLSPPPVSVPTSAAEREAARLRAELRDAQAERDELRRRQVDVEVEQSPLGAARRALLKRLWPLLAAAGASLATSVGGYLWGQAKGYADAFERVSKLEGAFRVERDRRAKLDGEAAAALANVNADLDTAFAKNREQDVKLGKLDKVIREAPVVVRPK